jgi:putative selenate reductase FAD-binding subunit
MPSCYNLLMVTDILKPSTIQEALKARALPGSAYLGGGTWLNASYSTKPVTLISLEKLGLNSIEAGQRRCVLGATVTFQQIVDHPGLVATIRYAAARTGSRTLRNMMTIGGEVALHCADSALIPVLLAMGTEVSIAGREPMPLQTFLSDQGDGLVLSLEISEPHRAAAVRVLSRTTHSPRSLVVATCADSFQPQPIGLRLVAADCQGPPVRLVRLERFLEGRPLPSRSEIEGGIGSEFVPQADIHASSRYKLYMTGVLAADALYEMREDALSVKAVGGGEGVV